MCGIVGYIGNRHAVPVMLDGLKRLEYRGYDSAGLAVLSRGILMGKKIAGRIESLERAWNVISSGATIGIGHTRWATHGEANETNAHPHFDCTGRHAVVHNGVIENHELLREGLKSRGHTFRSETDTEVIIHLIEDYFHSEGDLASAVRCALQELKGSYAVVIVSADEPDRLIAARCGSPLVIGYGDGEYFVASDPLGMNNLTKQIVFMEDGEMAVITRDTVTFTTLENMPLSKDIEYLDLDEADTNLGGFSHYMLKEIFEQPETIMKAFNRSLNLETGYPNSDEIIAAHDRIKHCNRLMFAACGTSWHASLIGKHLMEQYARKPAGVEYAAEFRYSNPLIGNDDVLIVLSQSGETADTLAALREAKRKGATTIGICNVPSSSIGRECDITIPLFAGPEIGVASTKAFTSEIVILSSLAMIFAREMGTAHTDNLKILEECRKLPDYIRSILSRNDEIKALAEQFFSSRDVIYLGRGYNYPVALEGALKLKEISCIHAEGYQAAEMKHGPIALVDENMPVVVVAPRDNTYDKILSNIAEVKARRGTVIAVVNDTENGIRKLADHVIVVPHTVDFLTPILTVIPLQLFAFHIAALKGFDVDKPRNLAKSVTVE